MPKTTKAEDFRREAEAIGRKANKAGAKKLMDAVLESSRLPFVQFKVQGLTPYLSGYFSASAKEKMLASQMQGGARDKAKSKSKKRQPVVDALQRIHFLEEDFPASKIPPEFLNLSPAEAVYEVPLTFLEGCRYACTSVAVKKAARDAARFTGMTMCHVDTGIFVTPVTSEFSSSFEIHTDQVPVMRCDPVNRSSGGSDLEFRVELHNWWAEFTVLYCKTLYTAEKVCSLVGAIAPARRARVVDAAV